MRGRGARRNASGPPVAWGADGQAGSDGVERCAPSDGPRTPGGARAARADGGGTGAGRADVRAGASVTGSATAAASSTRDTVRAWAELLRLPALFTVPGDAVAGAVAAGCRPNRRTALAAASSMCLYEAGMALNDYSDRHMDAFERPSRPLPSGRIAPGRALAASAALTAAGLGLAAAAGRRALLTASALAGTVWAYDLRLKHTPFGPAAMAAARGLDLMLGAAATAPSAATAATAPAAVAGAAQPAGTPRTSPADASRTDTPAGNPGGTAGRAGAPPGPRARPGLPPLSGPAATPGGVPRAAGLLGAHTFAVTAVSRREASGGSPVVPLAALSTVAALAAAAASAPGDGAGARAGRPALAAAAASGCAAAYAATAARPLAHAALEPTAPLLQRAVGAGIRATVPLQAALAARAGRPGAAAAVLALLPPAVRLSRKVSPT